MSDLLTLPGWTRAPANERTAVSRTIARGTGGRFEFQELRDGAAIFTTEDAEFAFVPGGSGTLGFEPSMLSLAAADVAFLVERGEFENAEDVQAQLEDLAFGFQYVMSPRRSATIPPLLVEVEAGELEDPSAAEFDKGFRLLKEDEWEWASGAGSGTLFRWGNRIPVEEMPTGQDSGNEHPALLAPNAFGIWIGQHPYAWEVVAGDWLKGGDGGGAWCGGEGTLRIWASLMIPRRHRRDGATGINVRRCVTVAAT